MKSNFRWSILAAPLALVACSNTSEAPKSASAVPAEKPLTLDKNPYPSTYKPYPGVATAIRNVTIFDGEGGRIENGVVFFANGKVSGVGGADTAIPEGTTIIDGTGKVVGGDDSTMFIFNKFAEAVPKINERISTLRDAPTWAVSNALDARSYVNLDALNDSLASLRLVDLRAGVLVADASIEQAYDPYAFVRDAYLQRREYKVRDGEMPETIDEPLEDPAGE